MNNTGLEFEKPLLEFEKKINELRELASLLKTDLSSEIKALDKRLMKAKRAAYSNLTPWQKVLVSKVPERPSSANYIDSLMRDKVELFGIPNLVSTIPGGVHGDVATCAITLNAVDQLLRAGSGLRTMADLPPNVESLGGHPMCGKETSGIEVADPALYQDRTFILSPTARTSDRALALGKALVEAVGANPLVIEAGRQDRLVATISHLPYVLACSLVSTADATTSADPLVWQIVAGGYRDTSRVAGSDVTMMVDILRTNRQEVIQAVKVCMSQMQRLADLIGRDDEDELRAALNVIREKRREMFP